MRLALLEFCLIGLIESARSVRPATSNVGDHSGQQFDRLLHSPLVYSPLPYLPSPYSPNSFAHHKSTHLQSHLERVKRQETIVWTMFLGTTQPSRFTDISEETDPTTRLTTGTTTRPIVPTELTTNPTPTEQTISRGTTKGTTFTTLTQDLTNRTGSETANLTLATTDGPHSTSFFLHFIWGFTLLFMIVSMSALCYLKKYSEKLNPRKDTVDDHNREDSGSTKDRMNSRTETQTENPEVGSKVLSSNIESRPNSGFSTDPKITLHHQSDYVEEIKNKLRNL